MTTVVIVEDHESFRTALSVVLGIEDDLEVVGDAARGDEGVALAGLRPDVAVVDLDLPGGDGTTAIRGIREASPSTACLVLTGSHDPVDLGRAVEAGAAAVLHKSVAMPDLISTIRTIAAGGSALDPSRTATWLQAMAASRGSAWHARAVQSSLSPRELEVLRLLGTGSTTDQIAATLTITPQTVQTHVRNLLAKLDVSSRLAAVTEGIRLGLVAPTVDVHDLPDPG